MQSKRRCAAGVEIATRAALYADRTTVLAVNTSSTGMGGRTVDLVYVVEVIVVGLIGLAAIWAIVHSKEGR
jgi:hypothetical protein